MRATAKPLTHRAALAGLLALAVLFAAAPSHARSVFLNGVKIDGLNNQTFKRATVHIDARGDVYITAKGYSVKELGTRRAAPTAEAASRQYWLVATETNPGKVQWDVDVHINGKRVARIKWNGGQVVTDISRYLVRGDNEILFRARRNLSRARMSYSPADKLNIVIGPGAKQGKAVVIRDDLARLTLTAAQTEPVDRQVTVRAR